MKVTQGRYEMGRRYAIEDLTAGQLAYIAALVGMSGSRANEGGSLSGSPVVPEARDLWQPLQIAVMSHGLEELTLKVERSQELWRRENVEAVA